jgi:hypothetical protein
MPRRFVRPIRELEVDGIDNDLLVAFANRRRLSRARAENSIE